MSDSHWKFSQCFGEKEETNVVAEADIISTLEFDDTGDYLATGDKGGRVVLFQRDKTKKHCEYHFFAEFQSHEPEFDYLKSLEIEEKINKIKWCKRSASSHYLLTTNDKTIKLWKVFEKSIYNVVDNNSLNLRARIQALKSAKQEDSSWTSCITLPKLMLQEEFMFAVPKKVYSAAHAYHINSISINSDGETFLSADDLRVHLWTLNNEKSSFNIVDIKPSNMEDLSEVITCSGFHPIHCHQFLYGTSKGLIKICDLRKSAICDKYAQILEDTTSTSKSFFSEIISSISDAKYSHDGRYVLSRDYLTLKLWDVNKLSNPVFTIPIHDHLRPKLFELYENDCIFDRFECGFNGTSSQFMTGSYGNQLFVYDVETGKQVDSIHSSKNIFLHSQNKSSKKDSELHTIFEPKKKILHASWHSKENTLAIAATNNLFIFSDLH